jgi:hypothetical protein
MRLVIGLLAGLALGFALTSRLARAEISQLISTREPQEPAA